MWQLTLSAMSRRGQFAADCTGSQTHILQSVCEAEATCGVASERKIYNAAQWMDHFLKLNVEDFGFDFLVWLFNILE